MSAHHGHEPRSFFLGSINGDDYFSSNHNAYLVLHKDGANIKVTDQDESLQTKGLIVREDKAI